MKKCLFFLSFLLLTSCAAQDGEQAARAIAARWKDAGAVTVTASITAEFSDRAADYRVQFAGNRSGGKVTVIAPESIAGICAQVGGDGTTLSFDGTVLETGVTNEDGVTPMNALPKLCAVWSGGNAAQLGAEKHEGTDAWLLVYRDAMMEYRTWFSRADLSPLAAEVLHDDRVILRIQYETCEM